MLSKITSRVSPAMAVATIALFAALGGGYATAFSGSGTLQKAGLNGVSTSFQDLRTLNGFGTLRVRCDTADDEMEYAIKNTTSSGLIHWAVSRMPNPAFDAGDVTVGDERVIGIGSGAPNATMRMHLYKTFSPGSGSHKAGVDIVVTNLGPAADVCNLAAVRVMALNTQE